MGNTEEETGLILKAGWEDIPGILFRVGCLVTRNDFEVLLRKKVTLTEKFCKEFYFVHVNEPYFGEMLEHLTKRSSYAFVIKGKNAISIVRTWVVKLRIEHEKTGKDSDNKAHASDCKSAAERETVIIIRSIPQEGP